MIAVAVELTLSFEDKQRLGKLVEICDDQSIVNRTLLAHGLLTPLGPDECRFYPYPDGDWWCMACVAGSHGENAIIRLPKSTGDLGKTFLLRYVTDTCQEQGGGIMTVGLQRVGGSNN
jgi:hypothetical protein